MTGSLTRLAEEGVIVDVDPEAAARLVSGATLHAAQWIANAEDPAAASRKSVEAVNALLEGLLVRDSG
jgi:hypothetical protein